MSECTNPQFENKLYAYELGALSDEARRDMELHLLECSSCNKRALEMDQAAQLLRHDPDIRQDIAQLDESESSTGTETGKQARAGRTRVIRIVATIAAVLVILLLRPWRLEFSHDDLAVATENRLAVMYFENLTPDQGNGNLGEIITSLLITDLSESHYMQVVSSQRLHDILRLLGNEDQKVIDKDIATRVADRAGSPWMLMGNIISENDITVLTSQLLEVTSGDIIATQKITGTPGENVFSLVDRLTVAIKQDLSLPIEALQEPDPMVADVTTHSPEAYRHYVEGLDFMSKLYYKEASASFERAVSIDSTFAMAFYHLASTKDRKYLAEAARHYQKASRKDRFYIRAREAVFSRNVTLAIQVLQEAVEQYPEEKDAHYMLGRFYSATNQTEEAITHFNRATELDPMFKLPYNNLAYLYNDQDDFDKAIEAINKYIELAPDEANPYDSRGQIFAENGHLTEAIESYERALEIKPDFTTSRMYLGYMYTYLGDYERARKHLEVLASSEEDILRSAGRIYLAYIPAYRGKYAEALRVLDSSIAADLADGADSDMELKHLMKALILAETGNSKQALVEIEQAMILRAREAGTRPRLDRHLDCQILASCGQLEWAESLADSLKTDLDNVSYPLTVYNYAMGSIEWSKGSPSAALPFFKKAADSSDLFYAHYMYARAALESEHLETAIQEFTRLQTNYNSPRLFYGIWSVSSHYYLGQAYEQSGQTENALAQYNEAVRILSEADPGNEILEKSRERLKALQGQS